MESGLHITLAAERLFTLWGVPVTSTVVTTWFVMALLLVGAFFIGRALKLSPGKAQSAIEMGVEYVFGYVRDTLGSEALAKRYFPLIMTIFVFILVANLSGSLPFFGTVGVHQTTIDHGEEHSELVPLFHTATADLNTTLALAIISFAVIELSGILTLGVLKYGSKFVNLSGGSLGEKLMNLAIGLLELIGNLARLISFSFRLFGAIFAGHVLLMVIGMFVPLILPVPLMAFELFIGLLQAAIFAILTLAFIKIAIAEPHGHDEHEHAHTTAVKA